MTTMNAHHELVIMNVKGNVMRLQRWMMCLVLACLSFAGSACFGPSFTDHPACGPNSECPLGTQCIGGTICVDNFCKTPDGDNLANGTQCANPGVPDGVCYNGDCKKTGCGDGQVVAPEVCDDGNQKDRDGCSADCRSNEQCGNLFVDSTRAEQCDEGVPGRSGDGCSSSCSVELDAWKNVTPVPLVGAGSLAMAFDSRRGRTVLFVGETADGPNETSPSETWEYDGIAWIRPRLATSPSTRASPTLAFDAQRNKLVLFGGEVRNDHEVALLNDTWEYDGINWEQRTTPTHPPAMAGAVMVFDMQRRTMVMFGGPTAATLSDTWEYDGVSWTQVSTTRRPANRTGPAMTYDERRNRTVLFGGISTSFEVLNDTWEFDGLNWSPMNPQNKPPVRFDGGMAFDTSRGVVELFGGRANGARCLMPGNTMESLGPPFALR
jgi:cysteine-rich repeat protein